MSVNNNLFPTNNIPLAEVNRSNTPTPATTSRDSTPTADTASQPDPTETANLKILLNEIDELRKIALTMDPKKIKPVSLNKKFFFLFKKEGKTPGTSKTYSIDTNDIELLGQGSFGIALNAKATNLEDISKKSKKVFKRAFFAGEKKGISTQRETKFLAQSEKDVIKSYTVLHNIIQTAKGYFQEKLKLADSEFEGKFGSNLKFTGIQSAPYNLTRLELDGKKMGTGFMAKRYEDDFANLNETYLKSKQQLPTKKKVEYAYQLIKGLQTLHALGLLHGDIKFENILYKKEKCDFIDFGGSLFVNTVKEQVKSLMEDYHKQLNSFSVTMMKGLLSKEDYEKIKNSLREKVGKSIEEALTPTLTITSFSFEEYMEFSRTIKKAKGILEKTLFENDLNYVIMEWENITKKMDIFALGRTLYELFCLPSEYQEVLPESFLDDYYYGLQIADEGIYIGAIEADLKKNGCPQELINLIKLMLEPNPTKKYITVDDAQKKFQTFCESQSEYKYLPEKYVL